MFRGICAIDADDDLSFEFLRTGDIREGDQYPGIRVFLRAIYEPLAVPLAIDATTGDKITPGAIAYEYPFVFDDGSARIMAYPLETILAEKRDVCDADTLGRALAATCSNATANPS